MKAPLIKYRTLEANLQCPINNNHRSRGSAFDGLLLGAMPCQVIGSQWQSDSLPLTTPPAVNAPSSVAPDIKLRCRFYSPTHAAVVGEEEGPRDEAKHPLRLLVESGRSRIGQTSN